MCNQIHNLNTKAYPYCYLHQKGNSPEDKCPYCGHDRCYHLNGHCVVPNCDCNRDVQWEIKYLGEGI